MQGCIATTPLRDDIANQLTPAARRNTVTWQAKLPAATTSNMSPTRQPGGRGARGQGVEGATQVISTPYTKFTAPKSRTPSQRTTPSIIGPMNTQYLETEQRTICVLTSQTDNGAQEFIGIVFKTQDRATNELRAFAAALQEMAQSRLLNTLVTS